MPINNIDVGTAADNGSGEGLRLGGQKINANFAYLKQYADNLIQGLKWKQRVVAATTANITLSGEQNIDGYTTNASRILVKDQTNKTENGIYVSNAGAWTRATDADTADKLVNATISVSGGNTQTNTNWTCDAGSIILGSTSINFVAFQGADGVDQGTFDAAIQLINDEIDALEVRVTDLENTNYAPPAPYATVAALLADQGNQIEHEEYTVEDASDYATQSLTGWATFQKKATSTASESDYVLREREQGSVSAGSEGHETYHVKDNNIKGDGIELKDGAITSGSNAFSSSSASFESNDVGKVIHIKGAGASGGFLTTTIASFVDPNNITTTANAATTVSNATYVYGTDDTVAIQNLIDTCFINGGGKMLFPNGIYILNGALKNNIGVDGINYNSQLHLPYVVDFDNRVAIEFEGEVMPPFTQGVGIAPVGGIGGVDYPTVKGTVFLSTIQGSGSEPSVICNRGVDGNSYVRAERSFVNGIFKNLNILVTPNSSNQATVGGLNLFRSNQAFMEAITVFPYSISLPDSGEPPLEITGISNGRLNCQKGWYIRDCSVGGMTNGYKFGEHGVLDNIDANACVNGIKLTQNTHPTHVIHANLDWCKNALTLSGGGNTFNILKMSTEWRNEGLWYDSQTIINDPSNYGKGVLYYTIGQAGGSINYDAFVRNGGKNIKAIPLAVDSIQREISTAYTLTITDPLRVNHFNSASTISIVVPNNTNVSFNIGDKIKGVQTNSGGLTFQGETGVEIRSVNGSFQTVNAFSEFTLEKINTNLWLLKIEAAGTQTLPLAPPYPVDQLISYYKLDETSGTAVVDSRGTNNGTNNGATINVTGKKGTAYSFDGTNDFLDLSALDGLVNGVDFSTGCWFKTTKTGIGSAYRLIQNRGQGAGGTVPGYVISEFDGVHYGNTVIDDGAGNIIDFVDVPYNEANNAWHLIILTWNSSLGRARLYIDGVLKSEKTDANLIGANLTGAGTLFGKSNQNAQYFQGSADEIFFYQKEITQTEIDNIYNSGAGNTI